jgi:hypothetical protein
MDIQILLSDFEIEILNKLMRTDAFADHSNYEKCLRNLISDQKEIAIRNGNTTEQDFQSFKSKTVFDISQFLNHNDFFTNREGRAFSLTEKGKQLKQQGSLQKYLEWEMAREAQLIADLHTIETRGYLDKDQTFSQEAKPVDKKYKNRILLYILLLAAIILLWIYGKSSM